jgi:hypothetical protein
VEVDDGDGVTGADAARALGEGDAVLAGAAVGLDAVGAALGDGGERVVGRGGLAHRVASCFTIWALQLEQYERPFLISVPHFEHHPSSS